MKPSVALFWHYLVPRVENEEWISGSVTWHLRDKIVYPTGHFKLKWDKWLHTWLWFHVDVDELHECCSEPKEPAKHDEAWCGKVPLDDALQVCVERINSLCARSLTANMIASDFLLRHLAPLQRRKHPAWEYKGAADITRLWPRPQYNLTPGEHWDLARQLFEPKDLESLPTTAPPLCNNDKCKEILALMPFCNGLGIAPGWVTPPLEYIAKMHYKIMERLVEEQP